MFIERTRSFNDVFIGRQRKVCLHINICTRDFCRSVPYSGIMDLKDLYLVMVQWKITKDKPRLHIKTVACTKEVEEGGICHLWRSVQGLKKLAKLESYGG